LKESPALTDPDTDSASSAIREHHLGRRDLMRWGGVGAAAALVIPSAGVERAVAAAPPEVDASFKDFSLPAFASDDDSLAKAQKDGLIAATSNDWPYSYLGPQDVWMGLDAEIISFVARMLKIPKVTVRPVDWDALVPGVLDRRFDMIADSINYTPERAEVVAFCFPTYYYAEAVVVKKGNPLNIHRLADLAGHACGSVLGSNYTEWLKTVPGITVRDYKDWKQLLPELAFGRVDAVLYDEPVMAATLLQHPEWAVEVANPYSHFILKNPNAYSRYVFRQSAIQLVSAFSAAIEWMQFHGEISRILEKGGLSGYNN
jgi:polar amino acid transport system substrate-binding protein